MTPELPYAQYRDKVLAGWLGKSLGGIVGAVLENQKQWHHETLDTLWPEKLVPNDDLDIQLVWLEAMQERGLFLTSRDLAEFWQDRCWYNFCEYGQFLHNVQRGIAPPLSGTWNNRFFAESEGCPIRSEIWGFVAPGHPVLAAELARQDGQLDHGGVSVEIEMFNAAAAAAAFVAPDLEAVVTAGLAVVPADSRLHAVTRHVRAICERFPKPEHAWRLIIRHYGDRDASKAVTNFAIVLLGLFLGNGDFKRTMLICVNSGWDTDCTAATAGALLGVLGGTAALPSDWVEQMGKRVVSGIKVRHQNARLTDLAEETCRLGVEMAAARPPAAVRLVGAPHVPVRPRPEPRIEIDVLYPEKPVLWKASATPVQIIVKNPFGTDCAGELLVTPPPGVTLETACHSLIVPACGRQEVVLSARRERLGDWLPDKNLFEAVWRQDGQERARRVFGLGGARQWLVYGPYWDMWDRRRYPECPYNNVDGKRTLWTVGCASDSYNQYAYLDHPYLDESRLIREELPEEMPMVLEAGEDTLETPQFGGFNGQACYYLTRTVRHHGEPTDSTLMVGRSGPCRIWWDGEEVFAADSMWQWTSQEAACRVRLTGAPQRLVVKLIRLTDVFTFHLAFAGAGDPTQQRGVSMLFDTLADQTISPKWGAI